MLRVYVILCFLFLLFQLAKSQDKYFQIQEKLMILSSVEIPALNEKVNISVTNVSVQELLRGIANNTGLNINVAPDLKIDVVNNFSNVKVIDILMFLCRQYDLNISVIGNIINIYKEKMELPLPVKKPLVKYDSVNSLLSIECEGEDLGILAKAIVDKTGLNVVPAPGLDLIKVKGYIQNMTVDNALDKFAFANNLKVRKTEDNVYLFEKNEPLPVTLNSIQQQRGNTNQKRQELNSGSPNLKVIHLIGDSISVSAENSLISDIVKEAADLIKADYFFTSPVQGESTLHIKGIGFPSLLNYLFICLQSGCYTIPPKQT